MPCEVRGGADDVVDARGVVAALGEHAHPGVEQPAHRATTLGAQLALLRGCARGVAAAAAAAVVATFFADGVRLLAGLRPDDLYDLATMLPATGLPAATREAARRFGDATAYVAADELAPLVPRRSTGCPTRSPSGWPRRGVGAGDVVALVLPPRPRVPVRVPGRGQARCVTAGVNDRLAPAERDGVLEIAHAAPRRSPRAEPRARRRGRRGGRRRRRPCADVATTLRVAGEAPPTLRRRPRPTRRHRVHVGHDRRCRRVRCSANRQLAVHHRHRRRRHLGRRRPRLHRHVVRPPRLHDQAAGQPPARRHQLHHGALARATTRCELIGRAADDHGRRACPTQLALMLREPDFDAYDLDSVAFLVVGGGPFTPGLAEEARTRFHAALATRYSCTEAGIGLGTAFDDPARGRGRQRRSPASRRRARAPRRGRPPGAGGRGRRRSACAPPP